ncbi:MAG: ferritin-like domain-containing protein [Verrucomicrobiia bacterium]|jgi:uncharacterized ferritin-like protein (DUF455 family)
MELRELAERALFSTDLETKLACPDVVVDTAPGPALATPDAPGRPDGLRFKGPSASSEFPSPHRLEDDRDRGALLHFFANHELLAVELMALVLLKFPDAPNAFRKGILRTLKEEQDHVRLYLNRMKECGVQFGELPVNGFFWRSISGMASPLDYVAGLSLTFEQANLDYSRFFAGRFSEAGDKGTAAILEQIYKDEISHVGYGLKWFRRWKDQSLSDWAAYSRQIAAPLSPNRAKGEPFNAEGRGKAGLDAEFIDELFVYSRSKGRTPDVYVFNPFTELRIGKGKGHKPNKFQRQLARDLSVIPIYLAQRDDIVLIPERPPIHFLGQLKSRGFPLPEFQEIPKLQINRHHELRERKLSDLRPWAWGPDSIALLKPLFANLTAHAANPEQRWNDGICELYSKAWDARFLKTFLDARSDRDWLCGDHDIGVHATSPEQTMDAIAGIRARGHFKVLVKSVHGAAGHGMIRLWEPEISDDQKNWIRNQTTEGLSVLVEPWHERLIDLSAQFEMTDKGLKLLGFTRVVNDLRGQFVASAVAPGIGQLVGSELSRFLHAGGKAAAKNRLQALFSDLASSLGTHLRARGFQGPLGIDIYVFRDADGQPRLKPIVEINPRYTMGRVAIELMRRAAPGRTGVLRLLNPTQLRAAESPSFADYATEMESRFPVRMAGQPKEKIDEGFVCLNDPCIVQCYLPVFHVGRSLDAILPQDQQA